MTQPEARFEIGDEVYFIEDSQTAEEFGLTEDDVFKVTDRTYVEGSKAPMAAQFGAGYDRWSYSLENDEMADMGGDEEELERADIL